MSDFLTFLSTVILSSVKNISMIENKTRKIMSDWHLILSILGLVWNVTHLVLLCCAIRKWNKKCASYGSSKQCFRFFSSVLFTSMVTYWELCLYQTISWDKAISIIIYFILRESIKWLLKNRHIRRIEFKFLH